MMPIFSLSPQILIESFDITVLTGARIPGSCHSSQICFVIFVQNPILFFVGFWYIL